MSATNTEQLAWRMGNGPFVFAGTPPILTGALDLVATTEDQVRVTRIPTAAGRKTKNRPAAVEMGTVRLAARVAPGGRVRATGQLAIDPTTPPGTYETSLVCGDQRVRAAVHVFAVHSVDVQPRPIHLVGHPDEAVTHPLVVTNRGNVAHDVAHSFIVFLEEHDWAGRAAVTALRDVAVDAKHQDYADQLLEELRATAPSPARVTVGTDTDELGPGDSLAFEARVKLPEGLVPGRTYFGSSPFAGGRFSVRVDCPRNKGSAKRSQP